MSATPAQRGYIHALAARAGMDEETRRDFLQRQTGERSPTRLRLAQAIAVIDALKTLTGGGGGAVAGLDTPVARKLRALWIAAYDLGLLRDRSDRALLSFLERQTGVSHVRFLREPGEATAAIEGLKSWLARGGKVAWPEGQQPPIAANKRAVLDAQWTRLIEIGAVKLLSGQTPTQTLGQYAFKVTQKQGWELFEPADYDRVQNAIGRKLRHALAARETQI